MSKRQTAVSRLTRRIVAEERISALLCRFNRRARILMLHGVGTPEYPAGTFRRQLQFLRRIFRLVSLAEVLGPDGAAHDSRPKLALTFDDGLKNNFSAAYPILRELQVPATFFVCPGLVETGRWLWNHECRARLSRLSDSQRLEFAASLGLESAQIEAIVRKLKYLPNAERLAAEKELRLLTPDFVPTESERLEYDMMTWNDLKSLDRNVVAVGGHSSHHEILTRLEPNHLEREVGGCKAWIERELDVPVRQFCYPDGAYDERVLSCVGRHFDLAVSTEKDWVPRRGSPLTLPRIPVAYNMPDLAWRVHRPTG